MAFKLDGSKVRLPSPIAPRGPFPVPPDIQASKEVIETGRQAYVMNCGGCHGMYGSTPMLPDFRRIPDQIQRAKKGPEKPALL